MDLAPVLVWEAVLVTALVSVWEVASVWEVVLVTALTSVWVAASAKELS